MAKKLFSLESSTEDIKEVILDAEESKLDAEEDQSNKIDEIKEKQKELEKDIELAQESINVFINNSEILLAIKNSKNLSASIESYYPIIKSVSRNLNIKKIPSLEDFKNSKTRDVVISIALENFFIDFLKKIWEKIKEFVIMVYKKVKEFFKKILGFNLELDVYEKEVEKRLIKIKPSEYTLTNKSHIETKLPSILASRTNTVYGVNDLLIDGKNKILNFISFLDDFNNFDQIKEFNNDIKTFIEIQLNQVNKVIIQSIYNNINNIAKDFYRELENIIKNNSINLDSLMQKISDENNEFQTNVINIKTKADELVKSSLTKDNINAKLNDSMIYNLSKNKFKFVEISSKDLTEDAYEYLYNKLEDLGSSIIHKVDITYKLPFSPELYFVIEKILTDFDEDLEIIKKMNMYMYLTKQLNEDVEQKLPPIPDKKALISFFELYKKLKDVNIKSINEKLEKTLGEIERNLIKFKEDKFNITFNLEKLNSNIEDIFNDIISKINNLKQINGINNEEVEVLNDFFIELRKNYRINTEMVSLIINNLITMNLILQQQLIDSLRQLYSTLTVCYTELRYEMIKYIYENTKRYNKF